MKHRTIHTMVILAFLSVISGCTLFEREADGPSSFEAYEQTEKVTIPTDNGEWTEEMTLEFCIPNGDGEVQKNVTKGIIEIIGKTAVARALGAPIGNTLKEVADNYVKVLKSDFKTVFDRLSKTEETFGTTLKLRIVCTYQNEKCAVFYIVDEGLHYKLEHRTEYVVRLSDGHLMTNDEIAKISVDDLTKLAREHKDEAQTDDVNLEGEYTLSIGAQGLLFHPNQLVLIEYAIPMEAVESYLTEEGKELLMAKTFDETYGKHPVEPIKGDLALFELQGPVKKVEVREGDVLNVYTFDTEGRLMSEKYDIAGMIVEDKLFDRTERDAQGRGAMRFRRPQVKETNTFDSLGRRQKMVYTIGGDLESAEVYYYDNNGLLYKQNTLGTIRDSYWFSTTKYFYYKTDEHGNWIERSSTSHELQKRVITYYGDNEQQETAPEPVNYEPGRGDLGGYDLRGPVKMVKYPKWECTFNEQGQLLTENGQNLKSIFPGGIKRDKNGRLKECHADAYGSRYYTYNEHGLPTEIAEDGYDRVFTYDEDGYVKTEVETIAPDMGDEEGEAEVTMSTYTIVEKDSYANWTKRKDQRGNLVQRKITYYE